MVLLALWAGYKLWDYYFDAPWTRDGHVRADMAPVAPDVSSFVSEVLVRDNVQVQRGDVLFRIDQARYAIALDQAEAVLAARRATLDNANADLKRYSALTTDLVVSRQRMDQVGATQATAKANYDQAVADCTLAKLNLERSEVRASVSGIVTNNELRPGAYLTPGKGVMALLETDTLHVQGYFEETKLQRIHVGDPVKVRLVASDQVLQGKVESVAAPRSQQWVHPLLTSIRPSTGSGWHNASRSGSRSTAPTSATNSSLAPRRRLKSLSRRREPKSRKPETDKPQQGILGAMVKTRPSPHLAGRRFRNFD